MNVGRVLFSALLLAALCAITTPLVAQRSSKNEVVHLHDAETLLDHLAGGDASFRLIDVRTHGEFASGHIAGAERIEYQMIGRALADEERDRPIVLYCRSGRRAGVALNTLTEMGFTNVINFGGVIHWPYELVRAEAE